MTDRNLGSLTFDLAYDAENRLVSVTGSGTPPTPTPTAPATVTHTPSPTATNTPSGPTPTPTPPASDLIFADSFESGDLSAWTSSTTDAGDLSVSTAAALKGSQGMQAVIDDTNVMYVTDDNPNAEPRYRVRFYFDPNSLTMASGDTHVIFRAMTGSSTYVLRMELRFSSGSYQIRAALVDDGTTWTDTTWLTISDASHSIELDWRAATSAGANDGGLTLWIDGTQQADLTDIDNDTRRIDRARLGPLSSVDTGTSGTYYFDAFESRRSSYIGPLAYNPPSGHFASYTLSRPQQQSGSFSATFVYDGDGKRVKSTIAGVTTYFVGAHYEVTGSTVIKYYYAGAQRIAMRTNGTLNYLLGDHLGSTSLTTNASGQVVSELRYKVWGEIRFSSGTTPTKYQYTGQYSYVQDFGLHFYNARWYDSSLGRFVQADTIIPGGVQGLDRYVYANNNAIKYTDPTGHDVCTDDGYCGNINNAGYWNRVIKDLSSSYGITFSGKWSQIDKLAALIGAVVVSGALASYTGLSSLDSFQAVFGELTFARSTSDPGYWGEYGQGTITFYAGATQWTTLVAHELGHAFNARIANNGGVTPYNTLSQGGIWTANGEQIAGVMAGFTVPGTGNTCGNRGTRQCFDSDGNPISANHYYRTFDGLGFNHSETLTSNEDFADTFANWATNSFDNNKYGFARSRFMTTNMAEWVTFAMGGR